MVASMDDIAIFIGRENIILFFKVPHQSARWNLAIVLAH
jgi:hypothetical protein